MSDKHDGPFDPKVLDAPRRDDGGPAFPSDGPADAISYWGMSLRDYFAAQVLPAVYAHALNEGVESQDAIVAEAYELADAMLEQRTKESS